VCPTRRIGRRVEVIEDDPPRRGHSREGDVEPSPDAEYEIGLAPPPETRSTAAGEDRVDVANHIHLTDSRSPTCTTVVASGTIAYPSATASEVTR